VRIHERDERLGRAGRHVIGDRRPLRIHGRARHLDAPEQRDGVELLDHEIRGDAPDVRMKDAHRGGDIEVLEVQ
jgi:hypothetical protein